MAEKWFLFLLFIAASAKRVEIKSCTMVSSAFVYSSGAEISSPSFSPSSWYNVTLPATVLAGLQQNNAYPDPLYNENLKLIPTDQFDVPWWYRCEFDAATDKTNILTFQGINYKANVWIDGEQVGNITNTIGTFISFDFLLTARSITTHVVAVEVYRPYNRAIGPGASADLDLAISFVDWAPYPPDSSMGASALSCLFSCMFY